MDHVESVVSAFLADPKAYVNIGIQAVLLIALIGARYLLKGMYFAASKGVSACKKSAPVVHAFTESLLKALDAEVRLYSCTLGEGVISSNGTLFLPAKHSVQSVNDSKKKITLPMLVRADGKDVEGMIPAKELKHVERKVAEVFKRLTAEKLERDRVRLASIVSGDCDLEVDDTKPIQHDQSKNQASARSPGGIPMTSDWKPYPVHADNGAMPMSKTPLAKNPPFTGPVPRKS